MTMKNPDLCPMPPHVFARDATGLTRALSAVDALAINILFYAFGCVFICPTSIGFYPGADLPVSYVLVTIALLSMAALYVLMSAAMPRTGGDYVWVTRVLSAPVGFMASFYFVMIILSFSGSVAALIIPWFLNAGLQGASIASGDRSYLKIATTLGSPVIRWTLNFIIGGLPLLMLLGIRKVMRILWVGFLAGGLAVVLTMGVLLTSGHETFVSAFNQANPTSYAAVIGSARTRGFTTEFTMSGTILGSIFAFFNLLGFGSAYFLGEIKEAGKTKTQWVGMAGGLIIMGLVSALFYAVVYLVVGAEFFHSVVYLFDVASPAYNLPFFGPQAGVFVAYATHIAAIPILVNILIAISYCVSTIAWSFVALRAIFAWSFDRVLPEKISAVDARGEPWVAVIVVTIVSELYMVLWNITTISTFLAYDIFGWAIAWVFVAIAGAMFPYRRRDLFAFAPPITKHKILGVYGVTWVGIIATAFSAIMAYAVVSPSFVGPLNPTFMFDILVVFVVGILIYGLSSFMRKRQGIPISAAYKTLPPE
jgi:amino acid transporter